MGLSTPTRLAVYVRRMGSPTQTFVRHHIEALHPGRTVVVSWQQGKDTGPWSSACPTIILRNAAVKEKEARARRAENLAAFLREHRVDTLLLEFFFDASWVIPVCNHLGIRCVAMGHGADASKHLLQPEAAETLRALERADAVVVVNQRLLQRLADRGIPRSLLHQISYGVEVPDTPPGHNRDLAAPIRCLAAGRMVEKKGPLVTLEAFRLAAESDPRLQLEMIGEGPLLEPLRARIAGTGLQDRVSLSGILPHAQVLERIAGADIFLQHSMTASDGDEEGLPVVILEAMARARPVVATRHAGIPEVINHGVQGLLVEEGDAPAMAREIKRLAADPDLRVHLGLAARQRIVQSCTRTRELDALRGLLQIPCPTHAPAATSPFTATARIPLVYIYSSSHSGSTLLDLILGAHPDIFGMGELKTLGRLWNQEGLSEPQMRCSCGTQRVNCGFWNAVRQGLADLDSPHPDGDPLGWDPESSGFAERTARLLRVIQTISGKSILCDNSKDFTRLEALAASPHFQMTVVHLVRDGRGVASSKKRRGMDFRRWLKKWERDNLKAARRLRQLDDAGSCTVVSLRYEPLVSNPQQAIGPLMRQLGLKWHPWQKSFPMMVSHAIAGNRMRLRDNQQIEVDSRPMRDLGRIGWLREGRIIRCGLREFGYPIGPWWL